MTGSLPSIRGRLSRLVAVLALLWAVLATALVWWAVRSEVLELLDETLQDSADVLAEVLAAGPLPASGATRVVAASGSTSHFAWQLVDSRGHVLARSKLAPEQAFHGQVRHGIASTGEGWHSYGRPLGEATLYVAQTMAERRETMAAVGMASAGAALFVGLLCLWVLRARLGRELLPLQAFSSAVRQHDPMQPGSELPPVTRAELAPMHDAISDLGRRLSRRLANERAFTAHAAHALRTPLAGMDAQLAVALREAPPALQPRLLRTRQAAGRLARVVTALLTLFRSGVDLQREPVDVGAMLARLPMEGLVIEAPAGTAVAADADLLAAALINLVDNALRHGARTLRVEVVGNVVRLLDDGSGAPPQRIAELQQALGSQQYEGPAGLGLGLMLADIVARAHGGGVRLLPAPVGFGVELDLGGLPPTTS
ncbi:sensor histidine kinase [Roseateles sp. LYH14W]|uniref:histidine kinase n=1 Tax=Pelomonas parva TaxID=3299032 RepID=A0ABW7EY01_9BURK